MTRVTTDGNEVVVLAVHCSNESRSTHLTILLLITVEPVDERLV